MSKKEKGKFNIKEIFTNKQYRAIAILIFYAILFAVIIVSIRLTPSTSINESGNHVSNLKGYDLIDGKNFNYKYIVTIDSDIFIYEGKKYGDEELLTVKKDGVKEEYYFTKKNTYKKENEKYVLVENKPYILFDFFDTDKLDEIILRSIEIDEENHQYKVDSQEIDNVVSPTFNLVESGDNYITLTYRNDNITGIAMDFSNYAKAAYEDYKKVIITLQYHDFNLIDDFEVEVIE